MKLAMAVIGSLPRPKDPIIVRAPSVVDGAFSFEGPDPRACHQGSGRLLAPSGQGERR